MGEILRAVCDATCISKRPAFYDVRVSGVVTPGPRTWRYAQTFLQLKAETWFLLMGWTQDVAIGPPSPLVWEQKVASSAFQVQDMKTSKIYIFDQLYKPNAGYTLNNIVTLPEYILFPPASLIGVFTSVPLTDLDGATRADSFVTFSGVEYQMPEGKG